MTAYWSKNKNIRLDNLGAYWRLNEASGTAVNDSGDNNCDGTAADVVWVEPSMGDDYTTAYFDGASGTIDVYSANLASVFNGVAGTLLIWAKVWHGAAWTDNASRILFQLKADANNYVQIYKSASNHLVWSYRGDKYIVKSTTTTDWMCLALTWDKNAGSSGEVKAYFNGAQEGATQVSLGTWTGSLSSPNCFIGSYDGTQLYWKGWAAHAAVWDIALTDTEIAQFSWIDPITDRAQADIDARTPKAFINVIDWKRIDDNSTAVQEMIQTGLGATVTLTDLTPPTITSFPTAPLINSLVENIDLLRKAASLPAALGIVELEYDYQAGPAASVPNFVTVNAWENNLDLLHTYVPFVAGYMFRSGVGEAGDERHWQTRFWG
jgi:hypothetical protein